MFKTPLHSNQSIERLKQEIVRLTREQTEALKTATYVGMTSDEARRHDERRAKITHLSQQLVRLQKAQ